MNEIRLIGLPIGGKRKNEEREEARVSLVVEKGLSVLSGTEARYPLTDKSEFRAVKKGKSEALSVATGLFKTSLMPVLWEKAYGAQSEEEWLEIQELVETINPQLEDINYFPEGKDGKTLLLMLMLNGRYESVHYVLNTFPDADVNACASLQDEGRYSVLSLLVMNSKMHRSQKDRSKTFKSRDLLRYIVDKCPNANWQAPIKATRKQLNCLSFMTSSRFYVFEVLHIMKNFPAQMNSDLESMWCLCVEQLVLHNPAKFFRLYHELLASTNVNANLEKYVDKFTKLMTKDNLLLCLRKYSDVALVFCDDIKLHMSKAFLSFFVPHFKRMFESGFSESSRAEVQVEYHPEIFKEIIFAKIFGSISINMRKFHSLIAMADYLELEDIKSLCEEWACQNILILDGKRPLHEIEKQELGWIAIQYNLQKMKQKLLKILLKKGYLEQKEMALASQLVAHITSLKLNTKHLATLDCLFSHAAKLEHLYMSTISLEIGEMLGSLTNLTTFECGGVDQKLPENLLAKFPKSLTKINLGMFALEDNFIQYLPTALEELDLRSHAISDPMLAEIPRGVQVLDLSQNRYITDEGIAHLPPTLKELRLVDSSITGNCLKHLPRGIKKLNISSIDELTTQNLADLPPELECLNIFAPEITDEGIDLLPKSISRLTLTGFEGTSAGIASLPQAITHLRLIDSLIDDAGLAALPKSLHRLRLRVLRGITTDGLSQMIQVQSSLQFLYISIAPNNDISLTPEWIEEVQQHLEMTYSRFIHIVIQKEVDEMET